MVPFGYKNPNNFPIAGLPCEKMLRKIYLDLWLFAECFCNDNKQMQFDGNENAPHASCNFVSTADQPT